MDLAGSSAIVSGGASGLGLATARRLLRKGASVVIVDLPASDGAAVAASLGDGVRFAPADVTDPDAVAAAVDSSSALGPLRVAVTCAGIAPAGKVLGRDKSTGASRVMDLGDFARAISINLIGTFNVVRLAAAAIAANQPVGTKEPGATDDQTGDQTGELIVTEERGVIVCTASVAAYDGQIGQAAYAASKGGIVAMTLPLARELAQHLVRVVSIAPGIFDTPMLAGLPEDVRTSLGQQVPHPSRLGDPAEFGALVAHIVDNPMLNGEVIRLDGAIRMAPR